MPQLGIFILVHIFSALLPPDDPENDREFYSVLGLEKGAKLEQIRKAYKKKSLQLHPDKVAQRRAHAGAIEEAAAEYELVQEAHEVLVNDEKRQRYHALQCSVTRYRFVAQGVLMNPQALMQNLAHSSFVDKTRLVALCSLIMAILWIQPVLVATKINHVLEERGTLQFTKWVTILVPYFMLHALVILFWSVVLVLAPPSARGSVALTVLEQIAWYVSIWRLARAWDGSLPEGTRYRSVFIPVYFALVLRWLQAIVTLHKIRRDIQRMISKDYLEEEVLQGKSLDDLTEEERQEIMTDFLLVNVPPDFEPIPPPTTIDEEGGVVEGAEQEAKKNIEEQKVFASAEYDAATEIYSSTMGNLVSSLIFTTVFLILLVLKLDDKIDANWWVVFTPTWIYLGSLLCYYSFTCICGSVRGDEVVLTLKGHNEDGEKEKDGQSENKENVAATDSQAKEQPQQINSEDETEVSPDDPRSKSADNFVDVEASARKFNRPKTEVKKNSQSDEHSHEEDDSNVPEDEREEDARRRQRQPEVDQQKQKEEEQPDIGNGASTTAEDGASKEDKDGGNDEDDGDHIELDEETFRAFQSAYAEAEQSAMEEQAKAATNCCKNCAQLVILCLVVAKLEMSYESQDPDDVGFNTFWILFPFLLFCALLCCLCACLIYGVSGDMDLTTENDGEGGTTNDAESQAQTPIIPLSAPSTDDEYTRSSASNIGANDPSSAAAANCDSVADSANLVSVDDKRSGDEASAVEDVPAPAPVGSTPMTNVISAEGTIDDLD